MWRKSKKLDKTGVDNNKSLTTIKRDIREDMKERNSTVFLPHYLHLLLFQRHSRLRYRDVPHRRVRRRRDFVNVDLIKKKHFLNKIKIYRK